MLWPAPFLRSTPTLEILFMAMFATVVGKMRKLRSRLGLSSPLRSPSRRITGVQCLAGPERLPLRIPLSRPTVSEASPRGGWLTYFAIGSRGGDGFHADQ
jgi:hypothetical protein